MEEFYKNRLFQKVQQKANQRVNYSLCSSKQQSILKKVQAQQKSQDYQNCTYMHKKLQPLQTNIYYQKQRDKNLLKLDTKTKTNCIRISLNSIKNSKKQQTNINIQNVCKQNAIYKISPIRYLKKDINDLSDLCILAQGRRQAFLRYQQRLRSTYNKQKYTSSRKSNKTSRTFVQKQNKHSKRQQFQINNPKQKEAGYQKRIKRVKTQQNVMRQIFSRYDYFKNDKQDVIGIVNKIKSSLNKNLNLRPYFDEQ